MSNPTISVIVPIFNVESYLDKCIDSILNQTFIDFELLLINDGSTDASADICAKYAKVDNRIKFYNKENGGVSTARNYGLSKAVGEYVCFIDSDDYVDNEFLAALITKGKKYGVDIVVEGEIKEYENKSIPFSFHETVIRDNNFSDLFAKMNLQKRCSPWGKLFKKDKIDKTGLKFREDVHLGEDIIFVMDYLHMTNSVAFISDSNYHYLQRQGSLTCRLNDYKSEIKGHIGYCTSVNKLIQKFNLNKKATKLLFQWGVIFSDRVKLSILKDKNIDRIKFLKTINWHNLVKYKTYHSTFELFWDYLLYLRMYRLFTKIYDLKSLQNA